MNVVNKSFLTTMSVDSYFIIAFIIIISPFLLIFFRAYLSLCERLFRLCHVLRAATLTTICSEQLKNASLQSAYSKQKCSHRTEFEKFMVSLPNSKNILSASPTDINRVLAWKDRHGKTVVHSDGYSDSHLQSTAKCNMP